ncbi:MAG: Vms1/Ankzf1 family peptidyl-tRNA hydrolase [Dehalococcoidia bacterium]
MPRTKTRATDGRRIESMIRELVEFHHDEGVLSVYLDIDPATAGREGYEAALIELWKPLHARPHDAWLGGRLEYEIAAVTEEVRAWEEAPGRAVAMFFSGPGSLRAVLPLRTPVRPLARFEPRPVLSPLIAAIDEHRRYGIVVFDKGRARILTVFLGEVEEEVMIEADGLGRTSVGGWGGYLQARYARHREHHLHEHARRTAERLWAIAQERPLHTLVLGGPEEALVALRVVLPRALAGLVVGTLPIEMFAGTAEIVGRVADVEAAARQQEDRELVEELTVGARKGAHAVLGWDDTLQALAEGRVHVLVLAGMPGGAGVECPEGHVLARGDELQVCPFCGEGLWHVDDVAEAAVRAALHTDARVHAISGGSQGLGRHGAGAILRY